MLEFTLNNRPFLLDNNSSVRVSWANTACFTDKIEGDIGRGIDVPVNDNNRALLGSPERFAKYNSAGSLKFTGFEARFSGVLLMSGTLVITNATAETYNGWLQSNLGVMGEALQNKKITEFAWPTAQDFVHQASWNDNDNYGIQYVYNPGFWDGKGKEEETEIHYNDVNGDPKTKTESKSVIMQNHYDNYYGAVNLYQPNLLLSSGCVISPFLHLRYALRESLRLNKWFINRNDMIGEDYDTSMFKNLRIYNNFNIVTPQFTTVPFNISIWDYNANSYFAPTANDVMTFTTWAISAFNYADLLPKISFKEFLLGIQNTLNFIFRFRNDGRVDIIDRNAIISSAAIDLSSYRVGDWVMGEKQELTLKFMPEYDKEDANFDTNFEDLSNRASDFKASVATKTNLLALVSPDFGELRMVTAENKIYEYKWKVVSQDDALQGGMQYDVLGWEFVSVGPQPYRFGNGDTEEEIKSNIGPIQNYESTIPGTYTPEVWQRGNLKTTRSLWTDFSFRLLNGNFTTYPESLWWEGPNGLFKTRWEAWARFWATRQTVEATFQFPVNMLEYLNNNISSKFRTAEGEFIIEEMSTEFSLDSIGVTRIKGYKI